MRKATSGPRAALRAAFSTLALASAPAAAEPRSLTDVVYDYAVTSYCGVLTPEVEVGFRRELAAITARDGLSEDEARTQRIAGWVAADKEWGNRGLGGFRAWCASDGARAAQHFRAITQGTRQSD